MWNDTAIKALNPTIAHLLPETEIIVAYVTTAQTSVQAIMEAISDRVPEFKNIVRRPPLKICMTKISPCSSRISYSGWSGLSARLSRGR